jgi:hypothetical protein
MCPSGKLSELPLRNCHQDAQGGFLCSKEGLVGLDLRELVTEVDTGVEPTLLPCSKGAAAQEVKQREPQHQQLTVTVTVTVMVTVTGTFGMRKAGVLLGSALLRPKHLQSYFHSYSLSAECFLLKSKCDFVAVLL